LNPRFRLRRPALYPG